MLVNFLMQIWIVVFPGLRHNRVQKSIGLPGKQVDLWYTMELLAT